MATNLDNCQHNLLLVIATALFIILATGLAGLVTINGEPLVIP